MFFKKKVQKLAAQNAAELLKGLQEIETQVEAIEKMPSVVDRFVGYADVKEKARLLEEKNSKHNDHYADIGSEIFGTPLVMTGAATVLAGVVAAAAFVSPFLIIALPVAVFGVIPGDRTKKAIEKRNEAILNGSVETLIANLNALRTYADTKTAEILQNELSQLAASDCCDELRERFPEVRDAFSKVASKIMRQEEQPRPVTVIKVKPKA